MHTPGSTYLTGLSVDFSMASVSQFLLLLLTPDFLCGLKELPIALWSKILSNKGNKIFINISLNTASKSWRANHVSFMLKNTMLTFPGWISWYNIITYRCINKHFILVLSSSVGGKSYCPEVSFSYYLLKRKLTKLVAKWLKLDKVNLISEFSSLRNYKLSLILINDSNIIQGGTKQKVSVCLFCLLVLKKRRI